MKQLFNAKAARRFIAPLFLSVAMLSPAAASVHKDILFSAQPEKLTAQEEAWVRTIFGKIDTGVIRKHRETRRPPGLSGNVAGVALGNNLGMIGRRYHAEDYVLRANSRQRGVFLHEITHIWQFQTMGAAGMNANLATCPKPDPYAYSLRAGDVFAQFCIEQQGRMVQNYSERFLTTRPGRSRQDLLLRDIVEAQFPGAKSLRLQYERLARGDSAPRMQSM